MTQPISILLCALGGEGGGVLTDWLVEAARHAGYPVQATSVPGVAQRTGATTYYLELLPTPADQLQGRQPVFGLNPLPGKLDVLVSSELLESARQVGNGYSTPDRTLLISSGNRTLTTHEKMRLGDGRVDDAALVSVLQHNSRVCHVLDMAHLTREAGTVVSAVMLGALAASGVLPMQRRDYEAVLAEGRPEAQWSASQRASLRGFALAWDAMAQQQQQAAFVAELVAPPAANVANAAHDLPTLQGFAPAAQEVLALGVARLTEYQNQRYADLYLQRMHAVQAVDADGQVTAEVARWLALWMAFDDIVRVADLKSRASRWQRVQQEVRARSGDVLKLYDHFKPGVPEFAALLPRALAERLLRWDQARVAQGKTPLAFPLKVATHSLSGWLVLRTLASLKWLRVIGHRYAEEQAHITQWLDAVIAGTRRDPAVGLAIARCGRLIKGYGSTHTRGHDNLQHILQHLAAGTTLASTAAQAAAIDQAREAALQDEAGRSLDQVMQQLGAPKRTLRAQPIRWVPRATPHR